MFARLALFSLTSSTAVPIGDALASAGGETHLVDWMWRGVPVLSMVTASLSVILVRQVIGSRDGKARGDNYLTGFLLLLMQGLVLSREELRSPFVAIAVGGGVGAGGFAVVEILRGRVLDWFKSGRILTMLTAAIEAAKVEAPASGPKKDEDRDGDENFPSEDPGARL